MYFRYKGYKGKFTKESDCGYFGRVVLKRDIVTFQGWNLVELQQAFQDSVEDYLDFCNELAVI